MSDWPEVPVTDLYDISSGLSKPRSEFGFGHGFVSFKDVLDNYFIPDELGALVNSSEKEQQKCSVKQGDVFLTRTSETQEDLGMSAVALHDYERATFNGFTKRLRPKPETDIVPEYAAYYFRGPSFRQQVTAMSTLSTRASLNNSMIERLTFTMPSRPFQEAIGQILKALDDKIELNRRMIATLESLARAIFKSWFVDFDPVRQNAVKINAGQMPASSQTLATHDPKVLDLFPSTFQDSGIPEGWEQTTLGDEVDFQTGFAFKSKFFTTEPPGTRLARGMNVKEGVFFWSNQARFWPEVTEDVEQYLLEVGDVLIGMDGSKVGKNWVRVREVDLPCLLVQRVARLRASDSVGENFLWILAGSSTFKHYVDSVKTGTSIPHISVGQIKKLSFVWPPNGDDRIFHEFETTVAPLTEQHDKNASESSALSKLRDTLLPQLLSGELPVPAALTLAEEALA